jgi:hypothetical protein
VSERLLDYYMIAKIDDVTTLRIQGRLTFEMESEFKIEDLVTVTCCV